ncbi:acetyl-CoA carboxylase biotin carboxyl carrier protein [soil metagenome]
MARGLAEIATAHNLSELIVDTKDTTLTIRRGPVGQVAMHLPQLQLPQMQMAHHGPQVAAPMSALAPTPAPIVDDKSHVVTSPFVGTFYRKPNPDSANYVAMGDKVDKGAVLCIVEAMKLMNEIEADAAGTITGILVEDGTSVEYGQPLFKITV